MRRAPNSARRRRAEHPGRHALRGGAQCQAVAQPALGAKVAQAWLRGQQQRRLWPETRLCSQRRKAKDLALMQRCVARPSLHLAPRRAAAGQPHAARGRERTLRRAERATKRGTPCARSCAAGGLCPPPHVRQGEGAALHRSTLPGGARAGARRRQERRAPLARATRPSAREGLTLLGLGTVNAAVRPRVARDARPTGAAAGLRATMRGAGGESGGGPPPDYPLLRQNFWPAAVGDEPAASQPPVERPRLGAGRAPPRPGLSLSIPNLSTLRAEEAPPSDMQVRCAPAPRALVLRACRAAAGRFARHASPAALRPPARSCVEKSWHTLTSSALAWRTAFLSAATPWRAAARRSRQRA